MSSTGIVFAILCPIRKNIGGVRPSSVSAPLENQRDLFEIPDERRLLQPGEPCPAAAVGARGRRAGARRARRAVADLEQGLVRRCRTLRALFAEVIGADADGVALIPATSYGLAIAAQNITARPGDRVVLVADEYPSTVYTWRAFAARHDAEVVTVARHDDESWTDAVLAASTSECGSCRYRTCAGRTAR